MTITKEQEVIHLLIDASQILDECCLEKESAETLSIAVKIAAKKKVEKNEEDDKCKLCVLPAAHRQVKDKQDHYPIANARQAKSALERVMKHKEVPEWFKGTLKQLQELVQKRVKKEYPEIKQ